MCDYKLCNKCNEYLVNEIKTLKNILPSFLWHILPGSHKNPFEEKYLFIIYTNQRHYGSWFQNDAFMVKDSVRNIGGRNLIYWNISLDFPEAIFIDKTIEIQQFNDDFGSGQLCRIVNAMKNDDVINLNVLCP